MKVNLLEVCKQYDIPIDFIQQLINIGTFNDVKIDIENDDYGEEAVKRMISCVCLHSFGMQIETIKEYILLELSPHDTRKERIDILQNHRKKQLKSMHRTKEVMDCLDCVLEELKQK